MFSFWRQQCGHTVLSLSVIEYFNLVSRPFICDLMVFSSDSFLLFFKWSFISSISFSFLFFSWPSCFSSHLLALAFKSLKMYKIYCNISEADSELKSVYFLLESYLICSCLRLLKTQSAIYDAELRDNICWIHLISRYFRQFCK